MTQTADLIIEDLTIDYGDVRVIENFSARIPEGSTVAIVGPSGSGKSSVIRAIAGLIPATAGRIRLGERELSRLPASHRQIGLVPQQYALFPHLSVRRNVEYGLRARGADAGERRRVVDRLLEFVDLTSFATRRPAELSGGQRQRVALARAMAIEPDVLLLDEPLGALDPQLRHDIRTQLTRILRATNSVNIIVTHDRHEALAMADYIIVMRAGAIEQFGRPEEIWRNPVTRFVAEFLCDARVLDAEVADTSVALYGGRWRVPHTVADAELSGGDGHRHLMVRRSSFALDSTFSDGAVAATVTNVEFAGESVMVTVDTGFAQFDVESPTPYRVGAACFVRLRVGAAHVVDLAEEQSC